MSVLVILGVGEFKGGKNSKYLLSSGKDSVVRLWELSTARCLIAYTGAGSAGKQEKRTQAIFNHTEGKYILYY